MKNFAPKFRWFILFIFFTLLTFGVYIIGIKIPAKYEIPVFSCPINSETSLGGSCYTLCHLRSWYENNPLSNIVFFLIYTLVAIILFGRLFCGFICPFGFIQDVIDKIRQLFKFDQIKFSENGYRIISIIKWSVLLIFIFGGVFWQFNFCDICPVIVFAPPLAGIKLPFFSISIITAVLIIVLSFFKRRFFCTICPLGLIVGLLHKISFVSLKKDCQACTECGACYEACPMGIKSIFTERQKSTVSTHDCLMCMECINKCPEKNALSLSYLGLKIYKASRKNFILNQGYKKELTVPKIKPKNKTKNKN